MPTQSITFSAETLLPEARAGAAVAEPAAGNKARQNTLKAAAAKTDLDFIIVLRVTEKGPEWSISLKAIACFNLFQNQKRSRSL